MALDSLFIRNSHRGQGGQQRSVLGGGGNIQGLSHHKRPYKVNTVYTGDLFIIYLLSRPLPHSLRSGRVPDLSVYGVSPELMLLVLESEEAMEDWEWESSSAELSWDRRLDPPGFRGSGWCGALPRLPWKPRPAAGLGFSAAL